jgi:hypothetical protein
LKKLTSVLIAGLKDVFKYYDKAGIHRQGRIKPEYLLTCFIGKRIADYNVKENLNLIIHLEEPTSNFRNGFTKYFPVSSDQSLTEKIEIRKGKIDIAIVKEETGYYPYRSIGAIEIKNINPTSRLFTADIKRLTELMRIAKPSSKERELKFPSRALKKEGKGLARKKA